MPEPKATLFDQVLVNPSVEPQDEERLSKQAKILLNKFLAAHKIGTKISNVEMLELIRRDFHTKRALQYNARLNEVRHALYHAGWMIDLVEKKPNGLNYYAITELWRSTFWKRVIQKGEEYKWEQWGRI